MLSIVIIGTGNVATHLFNTFLSYDTLNVLQVVGRSEDSLAYFANKTKTSLIANTIENADVYIIAVSDDAIAEVSEKLKKQKGLVVHTSGSVAMSILKPHQNNGIFYPLQTFTKSKLVNFRAIPICIEATQKKDLKILYFLAETISNHVYEVSSEQRKHLHLAAVFVNNFSNYMYTLGNEICEEHKVPFHILKPLITETAEKINDITPLQAQTGPARRNDVETMQRHLDQLTTKEQKNIYKLISESIQKKYGKEL